MAREFCSFTVEVAFFSEKSKTDLWGQVRRESSGPVALDPRASCTVDRHVLLPQIRRLGVQEVDERVDLGGEVKSDSA
jgi:hypothetical protein